jgi:hypothetical protein
MVIAHGGYPVFLGTGFTFLRQVKGILVLPVIEINISEFPDSCFILGIQFKGFGKICLGRIGFAHFIVHKAAFDIGISINGVKLNGFCKMA